MTHADYTDRQELLLRLGLDLNPQVNATETTFKTNHLAPNAAPPRWEDSMEIERQTLRAETATGNCAGRGL